MTASLFASDSAMLERMQRDWMYQDHGLDVSACFVSADTNAVEAAMLQKVLDELDAAKVDTQSLRDEAASLQSVPGNDVRWKTLYFKACELRRQTRLVPLLAKAQKIIYTKHCLLSGLAHYAYTDELTDQQSKEKDGYIERIADLRPGAQLCLMTVHPDGSVSNEVLLENAFGMIRDPNLSFDGTKIVFSMRKDYKNDDFHLYMMDLNTVVSSE
jgi:hypothetical protein